MAKIATPVSHLFENAQNGQLIASASDCLEVRERTLHLNWPKERLFHCDININMPWDEKTRDELLHVFHLKPNLDLATFQIASCYDAPVIQDRMFQPGGRKIERREMLQHIQTNVSWLKEKLPRAKLGVENNNFYPTPAYEVVTEADFLKEAVEGNGIFLLLDIAHAQVTAHNKKQSYESYLQALPLDSLIQLHICKPSIGTNGMAYDAHDLPDGAMIEEIQRLSQCYPVQYWTIEYYRDVEGVLKVIQELKKLQGVQKSG